MQEIKVWGFLAGLGMFLLGMYMLEQGLKGLGSSPMKRFLRNKTSSPLRGVFTGTLVTTFLQSSSLVGLIVLAFVGAGILELRNALGIILGSNLGTTFTGWIVTLIGFKLELVNYAQPMLALGAFGTVFLTRDSRPYYYSNLLLGLGLLLLGLAEMKNSFTVLTETMDVSLFQGKNLFYYFIAGAFFTAIIQSSSVAMMIVLSAMHAGIFNLQEAAPIVIGADLGTTSTVLLGSLKGSREKRRVALSHFFFNVITALLALLLMPVILYFITDMLSMTDPLLSVVTFHSLFNVIGICLFIPFIDRFILFLEWLLPDKKKDEEFKTCTYIRVVPAKVSDAAIEAVKKELFFLILSSIKLNLRCFKVKKKNIAPEVFQLLQTPHMKFDDEYALLKRTEGEILGYTYNVQAQTQDKEDLNELIDLNHAVRNTSYAAKFIKDIRHNLVDFRHTSSPTITEYQKEFMKEVNLIYRKLIELVNNNNPELSFEHFTEIKTYTRLIYEKFSQEIYRISGKDQINDLETSSLLNVNRAFFISNSAIIESIRVYLSLTKELSTEDNPIFIND